MLAGSSSNSWPRLLGSSIMKYSTDKSSKLYYKHKNSPMFMENVWSIVFSLQLFTIFILSYCKTRLVLCMRAIQDVTDDQWLAQYDSWLRLIVWNTLRRFENSLASVKVDFPSAWASCPEHVSKNNEHICPRSTVSSVRTRGSSSFWTDEVAHDEVFIRIRHPNDSRSVIKRAGNSGKNLWSTLDVFIGPRYSASF